MVQRLEGGSLADLRPGLLERYAAAFGLERRLERWQRANPELASRLVRPTGQPPMLAVIEQQMIGEILRNANLAPAAPASTAARRAVGRDGRVLQLKIVLEDIDPPIWRRVVVGADATLHGLHEIIQTTMGWHDSHLYRFDVNDAAYSDLALWDDPPADARDARRTRVVDLELSAGASFQYEYDFGDGWLHRLEVEQVHEVEDGAGRPSCLGGARACPPEDCGGPGGYQELLGILADPAHPEHDERREWVGEDFDPESFDVASVNARLARSRPRRRR